MMKNVLTGIIGLIISIAGIFYLNQDRPATLIKVKFRAEKADTMLLFTSRLNFIEADIKPTYYPYAAGEWQEAVFPISSDYPTRFLQLKMGKKANTLLLKSLSIEFPDKETTTFDQRALYSQLKENAYIQSVDTTQNHLRVKYYSGDPYFRSSLPEYPCEDWNFHSFLLESPLKTLVLVILFFSILLLTRRSQPWSWNILGNRYMGLFIPLLLILFLPFLGNYYKLYFFTLSTEKHPLAKFPDWQEEQIPIKKKIAATEKYISGHLPLRSAWVRANSLIDIKTFNTSPLPNILELGKDRWIYSIQYMAPDYFTAQLYSQAQLEYMETVVRKRKEWLSAKGIDYYIFFVPYKGRIYSENISHSKRKVSQMHPTIQLRSYLLERGHDYIITCHDTLLKYKPNEKAPLYHKFDTHWNHLGAFWGYHSIMEKLENKHSLGFRLTRKNIQFAEKYSDKADLSNLLAIGRDFKRHEIIITPQKGYQAQKDLPLPTSYPSFFYRTDSTKASKALVFHDSYGDYLRPFMAESFSQSAFLWTYQFDTAAINAYQPDIVIHESLEAFTDQIMVENLISSPQK